MSAVDWSTMSPNEIWAAVQALPKIAGPWTRFSDELPWYRNGVGGVVAAWVARPGPGDDKNRFFKDMDEADAYLRAAGFLLVDDGAQPCP